MKRNLDLIVKILEYFEAREEVSVVAELSLDDFEDNAVAYHLRRMYEAGLLDAETVTSSTTETRLIRVLPFGLTWEGHEFLDSIRQSSVKAKIKERLGGTISDMPFSVVKGLALSFAKELAGL
jgi:DNA-binding transcriptional ArsR family regulator